MKTWLGLLVCTVGLMAWLLASTRAVAWAWMGVANYTWDWASVVVLPVPLVTAGLLLLYRAEEDSYGEDE